MAPRKQTSKSVVTSARHDSSKILTEQLQLAARVEHLLSPLEENIAAVTLASLQHAEKELRQLGVGDESEISCPHHARFVELIHQRARYLASTQAAIDALETNLTEIRNLQPLLPASEHDRLAEISTDLARAAELLSRAESRGKVESLFDRLRQIF